MIGVLGGMGPVATADFFNKVIAATSATSSISGDEDHVPLLIQSDPRIPPRPPAILAGGTSPLPALLAGRDRLIAAGATALAMPCNTAHYWYADLARDCPVPFLSIVDAVFDELAAQVPKGVSIGLISTQATMAAQIFDKRLLAQGYTVLVPSEADMQARVTPAIHLVKANRPEQAAPLLEEAIRSLIARGASRVILACTETPVALEAVKSPLMAQCIDPTAALARLCVAWWTAHHKV
jgi:aspartate racemase